jgi:class 3 adenylate cyclase/tetratricopeptide (TPR) repeat protein
MKCSECQFDNREGVKFCEECGAKLDLECPRCKMKIPPGRKFCGECGHKLTEPSKAPAIDFSEPQSYTPKYLADKILTHRSSIEGERKVVTVLFADVANYTAMSAKLDPEEVHQIMDGCFKILMDEIHKYEGTINQFTGDGVMAIFGAPVAHEDHAQRACYSALLIQKAISDYGEKVKKDCGIEFKMRIGINSGPVVVGSIGDDLRMDYTAIGDTTNLASRIENEASPGSILVSESTHKIARDLFEFKPIGKVEVKGKEAPQEAYELLKTGQVETRFKASIAKGLTKFVGRKNSMLALKEPYDRVIAGSGQIVGVVGEAGVGKSRLLLEFVNQLPSGDMTYLEGRCLHYGGSIIYMPFLELIKSYFDIDEEDKEFIINKKIKEKILALDEKLVGIIPPIQALLSLKVEDESYLVLEPMQKREKTFEALRDLFIRASQEKPLILVIEDLHWIDKTSEEFLDYLIGWLANARIMLILLNRPEYSHQWGSKSYYTKIGLTQLGTVSSSKLVKAILEEGEIAPELEQLILNRAAGNPLFVEELTYSLLENGTIQKRDQKYMLDKNTSDLQVPDTIQGIIAARMDRLEENLKRTMQVASVIGREFAFRILQIISGMRQEIKSYLLNLQGLEFIYEKSLFPELEYIFKHAFTQEVAYNSLLLAKRKEIHEKIGNAIEQLYPHRLEEFYEMLTYHYSMSNDMEKAYQYLKLSGNKATRNYSNWEAFRFYKAAINILKQKNETEENNRKNLEIIQLMAIPMSLLGYPEDSLQILHEGEKNAKDIGNERSLANIYNILSHCYVIIGDPKLGTKYSENCLQEAEKIQDIELMAQIAPNICTTYFAAGEFFKVINVAPVILDLLEKTHRELDFFGSRYNVYSGLSAYYGLALGMVGDFAEGKIVLDKGLRCSLEVNSAYSLGWLEFCYGAFLMCLGDGENSIKHLQKCIKYLEEAQAAYLLPTAWYFLAHGFFLLGKIDTAEKHFKKGHKIQTDIGLTFSLAYYYYLLSRLHFESGELEKAKDSIEEAVILSRKTNEKFLEGISWTLKGRILGKRESSQIDEANECIQKGIKILHELKLKTWFSQGYLLLGELFADIGRKEEAIENLQRAEKNFREMGMDYWLVKTHEALERL